jgi:pyrroloquinoline quinone (PQQ) biosynthesis protein C
MLQDRYAQLFDESVRAKAMKWLKLHAKYDDAHPWEALEIIVTLVGLHPDNHSHCKMPSARVTSSCACCWITTCARPRPCACPAAAS